MGFPRVKASTTARGYGAAHQRERKAKLPHAYGTSCVRCHRTMHHGQALHYDHNDARDGYLGFSHRLCNLKAGAREGNRRSRGAKRIMPTSRSW